MATIKFLEYGEYPTFIGWVIEADGKPASLLETIHFDSEGPVIPPNAVGMLMAADSGNCKFIELED